MADGPLDASLNQPLMGGPSFGLGHRLRRALWTLVWTVLAAWTPPPLHRWRVLLVRVFGGHVHWSAHVYGGARIWYPPNLTMKANSTLAQGVICYCIGPIEIGERAVISQRSHLCGGTHAIEDADHQLEVRPIVIQDDAWVAAEAFVGPGVTMGQGAVLAARAVAFKDLEAWTVYVGNPAQPQKRRAHPQATPQAGGKT